MCWGGLQLWIGALIQDSTQKHKLYFDGSCSLLFHCFCQCDFFFFVSWARGFVSFLCGFPVVHLQHLLFTK